MSSDSFNEWLLVGHDHKQQHPQQHPHPHPQQHPHPHPTNKRWSLGGKVLLVVLLLCFCTLCEYVFTNGSFRKDALVSTSTEEQRGVQNPEVLKSNKAPETTVEEEDAESGSPPDVVSSKEASEYSKEGQVDNPDKADISRADTLMRSFRMEGDVQLNTGLPDPLFVNVQDVLGLVLRGKLHSDKQQQQQDTGTFSHRFSGTWCPNMDVLLNYNDDQKHRLCYNFQYDLDTDTAKTPPSGTYYGHYVVRKNMKTKTGSWRKAFEHLELYFTLNSAGYYNVEGRGTQMRGRHVVQGVYRQDINEITIFRFFEPGDPRDPRATETTESSKSHEEVDENLIKKGPY